MTTRDISRFLRTESGSRWSGILGLFAVIGGGILLIVYIGLFGIDDVPGWKTRSPADSIAVGRLATVTEAELGVKIYPDSAPERGSGMRISRPGEVAISAGYLTNADAKAVLAFYRKEMPGAQSRTEESGRVRLLQQTSASGTEEDIAVTVTPKAQVKDAMTRILIVHTTRQLRR